MGGGGQHLERTAQPERLPNHKSERPVGRQKEQRGQQHPPLGQKMQARRKSRQNLDKISGNIPCTVSGSAILHFRIVPQRDEFSIDSVWAVVYFCVAQLLCFDSRATVYFYSINCGFSMTASSRPYYSIDFSTQTSARATARLSFFVLLLLLSSVFLLAGCGSEESAATATPTKTPLPAGEPVIATPAPVAQATDTAVPSPIAIAETPPTATPLPANVAPYTGKEVADVSLLQQKPIFICINNDAIGRSAHFGLNKADLVYEYIVDGFTVTRITALYQSQTAARVGPVRSARMPNIWMTQMYDGVLACSGGSDEIRYLLKNEVGFPYLDMDIDDPSNTVYFSSVGSDYRTRVQLSTDAVRRWLQDMGKDTQVWSRPGFSYSETPATFDAGPANTVQIPYPGGNSVEWRFDTQRNQYVRFQGGQPHIDNETGAQIVSDNVIILFASHELTNMVEDSLGTKGVDVDLYGFGDFRIFRNGRVYEGTWRANDESPPRWLGPGEQIVPLKPGQSWIQVVRPTDTITYQ